MGAWGYYVNVSLIFVFFKTNVISINLMVKDNQMLHNNENM